MGLLDKVTGVFWTSDESTSTPQSQSNPQQQQAPVTQSQPQQMAYQAPVMSQPVGMVSQPVGMTVESPNTVTPSSVFAPNAGFNQEMYDKIMTVLEKNNMDGFDYFEFRQSVVNANAMPLPEADKYRTIFSMAKPFGVTKEKLLSSIDFYVQKLDEHKQGFANYIASLREQEVTTREQKRVNNEALIQQKNEMIRQLNDEINVLHQECTALSTEVYAQNAQITTKEQSFASTFDVVVKQLSDDRTKIDTYIPANS